MNRHPEPTTGPPPARSLGPQSPPPPQEHPFNPSGSSMVGHYDVYELRMMFSFLIQQQPVNVEQSLPSRAMPDTGPPKQLLNYKRAPTSINNKQKTKPKKK